MTHIKSIIIVETVNSCCSVEVPRAGLALALDVALCPLRPGIIVLVFPILIVEPLNMLPLNYYILVLIIMMERKQIFGVCKQKLNFTKS